MGIKENNGHAARRRVWYRLLACLCAIFGTLLALLAFFQAGKLLLYQTQQPLLLSRRDKLRKAEKRHHAFRQKWHAEHDGEGEWERKHLDATEKEIVLKEILEGKLQLINVMPNMDWIRQGQMHGEEQDEVHKNKNYQDFLRATFCKLEWSSHEQDPSATPMFRDVIAVSGCNDNPRRMHDMDLYQVVQSARLYDDQQQKKQKNTDDTVAGQALPVAGVVFHESRCGSTLLANLMQWHEPQENIVYSESPPPVAILSMARQEPSLLPNTLLQTMLQDVVYVMSRRPAGTNKQRVFFKIQSIGTLGLNLFRQAFPNTPWLFAYRDPVEVMISHLIPAGRNANCVRSQHQTPDGPPTAIHHVIEKYTPHGTSYQQLSNEEYCAAHLAALTEEAVSALSQHQLSQENHGKMTLGLAVNYRDLPHIFTNVILPQVWNLTVDKASMERMLAGSTSYSKGRGHKAGQEFHQDSQSKQEQASKALRQAAQQFLQPSYQQLQALAEEFKAMHHHHLSSSSWGQQDEQ